MTDLLNKSQVWEITIITPLHVGDGEELNLDMDYTPERGFLNVYHPESVFSALADHPRAVNEAGRAEFNLKRFFKDYGISPEPQYSLPFKGNRAPDTLRKFMKNGFGLPYLAGSTLKGGVRTALWTALDPSKLLPIRNIKDLKTGVDRLGGKNPRQDFLRPLRVGDSAPVVPDGALEAAEIKWLNLNRDGRGGWRDFASRRTFPDDKQANGIYVEAIKPGVALHAKVSVSSFLTSGTIRKTREIKYSKDLDGPDSLASAVNRHSLKISRNETEFFKKAGAAAPADFYDRLIRRIETETDGFFLRIAWGGGWRSMTGDWIPENDLRTLRTINTRLGKPGAEIFPKTRRLAVKDGFPHLPPGWVKIRPADQDAFDRAVKAAANHEIPVSAGTKARPAPKAPVRPPVDPEQARREKMEQFRKVLENESNLAGNFQSYKARITPIEDEALKREMCRALLEKAQSLPKKKKLSKALKEGKSWAAELKTLCETFGIEVRGGMS